VLSTTLVAVTVTVPGGTVAGTVYTPAVEIVPTYALPPLMPFTLQVTPMFAVPVTVAVKVCWADVARVMGENMTETAIMVEPTVTVAETNCLESAALVAFTVTGLGFGRPEDAV